MAERKRAIEIVLSGEVNGSLPASFAKAQGLIRRYQTALTGMTVKERQAKQSAMQLGSGLLKAAAGAAAAYISIGYLKDQYDLSIKAAEELIKVETRYQVLTSRVPGTTRAQMQALAQYSDKLSNTNTISQKANLIGASQLATFGLHTSAIRKLLPALDDMAVGMHGVNVSQEDMIQIAKMAGKAMAGIPTALQRAGVVLTKAQKVMLGGDKKHSPVGEAQRAAIVVGALTQRYGGLAAASAKSAPGRPAMIAKGWESMRTAVGQKLLPYREQFLSALQAHMPQIRAGLLGAVNLIIRIGQAAIRTGAFIKRNWGWIAPIAAGITAGILAWQAALLYLSIASKVMTAAQWLFNTSLWSCPIVWIIAGIAALVAGIVLLVMHWKQVVHWLKVAWAWFMKLPGVKPVIDTIVKVWNGLVEGLKAAWNWVKKIWDKIMNSKFAKMLGQVASVAGKGIASAAKFTGREYVAGMKWGYNTLAGARAGGGPVTAGRSYLVGERGPEIFRPSVSGMVLAGGGGMTFAPVVHIHGGASRKDVQDGIRGSFGEFKRMYSRMVREEQRRSNR